MTPFGLSLLFKVAAEVDRYEAVFEDCLDGSIMMPHETVTCVCILARNAESKFLRFAEEVAKHCREKCMMSIAVYSALEKVHAYCGFHGRACDLLQVIIASGLAPDEFMYGCLTRFSAQCGRTELSQELSRLAPELDIQNYMSLIRAAGRDRAFQLLEKLKGAGDKVDLACTIACWMLASMQVIPPVSWCSRRPCAKSSVV